MNRKRVVFIGNNPAPYRVPVFNFLAEQSDFDFLALFSTPKEPIRDWNLPELNFAHAYMKECYFLFRGEHVHVNVDVLLHLVKVRPDLLIISGFNFTCILGFLYSLFFGCKLGLMIDGTPFSEARLTWIHRLIRKMVCWRISVWCGPSDQTLALFRAMGANPGDCFKSVLCVRNEAFSSGQKTDPTVGLFDLMFCGRFSEGKNPCFAIEVAERLSSLLGREVSLLMLGSGPLVERTQGRAKKAQTLSVKFPGFARQEDLPAWYRQCRIFLFPTSIDPWGVVANEACASGMPVFVTPYAGVAGELIIDHVTGRILPLDSAAWAQAIALLLTQPQDYERMSWNCRDMVKAYSFEQAAAGMISAIRHGLEVPSQGS